MYYNNSNKGKSLLYLRIDFHFCSHGILFVNVFLIQGSSSYLTIYRLRFSLGRVAISGSVDGILVISSLTTGMTIRVLNDHKGGQLNTITQQQVYKTPFILLCLSLIHI